VDQVTHCFHHTDVETGRRCTRCGRPACHLCLRQASVGAHCFECVRAAAPSRRERHKVRTALQGHRPWVVGTVAVANVVLFLLTSDLTRSGGGSLRREVVLDWSTSGRPIADLGEWWRLATGGFLHFDLRHLGMNMVMLFSAGALILSPNAYTAGASGAVYGLMGALYVVETRRGGDPWNDGLGSLIAINVVLSFLIPNISIGGHLGGLVAGGAAGLVLGEGRVPATPAATLRTWLLLVGLGVVAVLAALYGASGWSSVR
jgi:membrane associated rhomboid family serine protease